MTVKVLKIDQKNPDAAVISEAAGVLRSGGIVSFPTETVYAVAACLDNAGAIQRLRRIKDRPACEPFPVQVTDMDAASCLVDSVPVFAAKLMKHFWPGPLTIVFSEAGSVVGKRAGGEGIGIRVPDNSVAQGILKGVSSPLAVPSANTRGSAPALCAKKVLSYFSGQLDLLLDGGEPRIKEASTVIRIYPSTSTGELARTEKWEILREGSLKEADIRSCLFEK